MGVIVSVFKSHHAKQFLEDLAGERQRQITMWSHDHDDAHTRADWSDMIFDYDLKLDLIIYSRDQTPFKHRLVQIAALAMAAYESECRKEESSREREARG